METFTKAELEARHDDCLRKSENTLSQHCYAYGAEANLIEELLNEMEDGDTIEYDEYQWVRYTENLLAEHIGFIYKDWYVGKVADNIYAWMLFAIYNDVSLSDTHMAEETAKIGWELPEWYKEEYCDDEEDEDEETPTSIGIGKGYFHTSDVYYWKGDVDVDGEEVNYGNLRDEYGDEVADSLITHEGSEYCLPHDEFPYEKRSMDEWLLEEYGEMSIASPLLVMVWGRRYATLTTDDGWETYYSDEYGSGDWGSDEYLIYKGEILSADTRQQLEGRVVFPHRIVGSERDEAMDKLVGEITNCSTTLQSITNLYTEYEKMSDEDKAGDVGEDKKTDIRISISEYHLLKSSVSDFMNHKEYDEMFISDVEKEIHKVISTI